MTKKHAIIVAGGEGTRMGGALPKQFRDLWGRPVAWWSMKAFADEDPTTRIVLVVNPRCFGLWEELAAQLPESDRIAHKVVAGGASRTESVKNGLREVPLDGDVLVAVHDAARPLVSPELIARGWATAWKEGGAVPAVPVVDSLRMLEPGGGSRAVDRSRFVAVQTPQVFRACELARAYELNPGASLTDDASAFELAGGRAALYEGAPSNFKITSPGDLARAEALLAATARNA